MYISKLTLVNYRNFNNTTLRFRKGVNTIIGENGSGKSNVLRAIRLLLDDNMVRAAHRLDVTDFHRGLDEWKGHWIIISVEFEELSTDANHTFEVDFAIAGNHETIAQTVNAVYKQQQQSVTSALASLRSGDQTRIGLRTLKMAEYAGIPI